MADVADIAGLHDVELAALAAAGQRAAFGELVRRHGSAGARARKASSRSSRASAPP